MSKLWICIFSLFIFIGIASAEDISGSIPKPLRNGFTVDIFTYVHKDGWIFHGRIYMGKGKVRTEEGTVVYPSIFAGTGTVIEIVREDKHMALFMEPELKKYSEGPSVNIHRDRMSALKYFLMNGKFIGKETIEGLRVDKYDKSAGSCKIVSYFLSSSQLPLKTERVCNTGNYKDSGSWTDQYKNFKLGEPPSEVFDLKVPQGYKEMKFNYVNRSH